MEAHPKPMRQLQARTGWWVAAVAVGLGLPTGGCAAPPQRHPVEDAGATAAIVSVVAANGPARAASQPSRRAVRKRLPGNRFVPRQGPSGTDNRQIEAYTLYCKARAMERRRQFDDAILTYQKVVRLDPRAAEALKRLGVLCLSSGRTKQGLAYYRHAAQLDADDHYTRFELSQELKGLGRLDDATKMLAQGLASKSLDRRSPRYVLYVKTLATMCEAMGEVKQAAKWYGELAKVLAAPQAYRLTRQQRRLLLSRPSHQYEHIGTVFLRAERYDDAVRCFRQAQAAAPGRVDLMFRLAEVHFARGDHAKALVECERYLAKKPIGSRGYRLLDRILIALKREKELLPQLEREAKRGPENLSLRVFLAEKLLEGGQRDRARQTYEEVFEQSPSVDVGRVLVGMYRRDGQAKPLLKVLGKILEDPGRTRAVAVQLAQVAKDTKLRHAVVAGCDEQMEADPTAVSFGAHYAVALLCDRAKQVDEAARHYRECIGRRPKLSLPYDSLGRLYWNHEKYEAALAVFKEAQAAGAEKGTYFRQLQALMLALLDRKTQAIELARGCVKLTPDDPAAHGTLAYLLFHANRSDEALKAYQRIVDQFPESHQGRRARYMISGIYAQRKEMGKAEKILEEILREDPDDAEANNDLGYLWADRGVNLGRAEKMIRKAVAHEPTNAAYLDSLGWVLYRLGRLAEAVKYLEKAVQAERGDDPVLHDHLGDVYLKLDRPRDAERAWKRALDLFKKKRKAEQEKRQGVEKKLDRLRRQIRKAPSSSPSQRRR